MNYSLTLYLVYKHKLPWQKQKQLQKLEQWSGYTEEYGEVSHWRSHSQDLRSPISNKRYGTSPMFRNQSLKTEFCPVCKANLGVRDTNEFFVAKCSDCQFFYSWKVGENKPKAMSVKEKEKKECGCSSCKALGR